MANDELGDDCMMCLRRELITLLVLAGVLMSVSRPGSTAPHGIGDAAHHAFAGTVPGHTTQPHHGGHATIAGDAAEGFGDPDFGSCHDAVCSIAGAVLAEAMSDFGISLRQSLERPRSDALLPTLFQSPPFKPPR